LEGESWITNKGVHYLGGGTCSSELWLTPLVSGVPQRVPESLLSRLVCLSVVSKFILALLVPSVSPSRREPELPHSCGDGCLI
jgi:hypothetical protein